jgi:branched-subunit amino acid ABC-type transport system permease component
VQGRALVKALGINVHRVFTLVFILRAGMAAPAGIGTLMGPIPAAAS